MELEKELKGRREDLLQALLSDNYKQSFTGNLCDSEGYGVWGVACEVYSNSSGEELDKVEEDGVYSYDGFFYSMPTKVAKYFGINESLEHYVNYMNDDEKLDFEEIVIELMEKFKIINRYDTYSTRNYSYADYLD